MPHTPTTNHEDHEPRTRNGRVRGRRNDRRGPARSPRPPGFRGRPASRGSRRERGAGAAGAGDAAELGARWMPRRRRPRKDAATRRNAPGRRWQPAIRGCPNGATRPGSNPVTAAMRGAPGELKHLSTRRKREDSPSSGERTGRSPNPGGARARWRCRAGVGRGHRRGRRTPRRATRRSRTPLERAAGAGESPVGDAACRRVGALREYRPTRGIGREAGRTTAQG
jgi:hypothetical protein